MLRMTDYPLVAFVVTFVGMAVAAELGAWMASRRDQTAGADTREAFTVVQAATLTLLGLIIGFTFSMAVSRYDQRKNLEEEEANAIGTAYLRADLLPEADAARMRALLKEYTAQRLRFYRTGDDDELRDVNARTGKLQNDLWAAVRGPAIAAPNPVIALAVASVNDVINSQGYTQAAWWNRIPRTAWWLMVAMAIAANVLIGVGTRQPRAAARLLLVLPLVVAIAFFLIADIDAPRGGVIRVIPQNLQTLADSLR
jgi:hypothetical protein